MTKADQFDLAKIRLDPTDPVHATAKHARKRKDPSKWERRYTQFPYAWEERLRDCKAAGSTYRLALYLLYAHWRNGGRRIRLSNGVLAAAGVDRTTKWVGLRALEQAGLIKVEYRQRKAPMIECLRLGDLQEVL
jgi:hypothetical protein